MSRLIFRAVYDFPSREEREHFLRVNAANKAPERLTRVRARRKSFLDEVTPPAPPAGPCTDPTCPEHCPDTMGPPDEETESRCP